MQLLEEIGLRADNEELLWDYFEHSVVPAIQQYQTHLIDDSTVMPESAYACESGATSDQQRLCTVQDLAELLCKAVADKPLSQVIHTVVHDS